MPEFVHPRLEEEITSISGHYVLAHEKVLRYGGKDVLCFLGYAVCDTSCCGSSGWAYALVAGFVLGFKVRKNQEGCWISEVEPVSDEGTRKAIAGMIGRQAGIRQVVFR